MQIWHHLLTFKLKIIYFTVQSYYNTGGDNCVGDTWPITLIFYHICGFCNIVSFWTILLQGHYSMRRHHLIGLRIPIIYLRRSSDHLIFVMGISIPIRCCLFSELSPTTWLYQHLKKQGNVLNGTYLPIVFWTDCLPNSKFVLFVIKVC